MNEIIVVRYEDKVFFLEEKLLMKLLFTHVITKERQINGQCSVHIEILQALINISLCVSKLVISSPTSIQPKEKLSRKKRLLFFRTVS